MDSFTEPTPPRDIIGELVAYESGELDARGVLDLFSHLLRTGLIGGLQGSYGRAAQALVDNCLIEADGTITDNGHELANFEPQVDVPDDFDADAALEADYRLRHSFEADTRIGYSNLCGVVDTWGGREGDGPVPCGWERDDHTS